MKTYIIFQEYDDFPSYFIVEGNHRSLNEVIINSTEGIEADNLLSLIYNKEGEKILKEYTLSEWIKSIRAEKYNHDFVVIQCGFAL